MSKSFNNIMISRIENALKLHSNYNCNYSSDYLINMDRLAAQNGYFEGAKSQRLCSMLSDYYKQVGVKNLNEALNRLRSLEE